MDRYLGFLLAGLVLWHTNVVAAEPALVESFKQALLPGRAVGRAAPAPDIDQPTLVMHVDFEVDSFQLTAEAVRYLDALGTALSESRVMRSYLYRVEGHTCSQGDARVNRQLSQQRAQAVVDYLVQHFPLLPEQFEVVIYGEDRPLVPHCTAAEQRKNHRVLIVNTLKKLPSPVPGKPRVEVQVKYVRAGSIDILPENATLTRRDGYAVEFTPQDNAYVYVCQADAYGHIDTLFPNPDYGTDTNPATSDQLYRVPTFGRWFYLDDNKGREHIVVIAHRQALKEPVSLCQKTLGAHVKGRGIGGIRETPNMPLTTRHEAGSDVGDWEQLFVWKRSFLHQ
jgi:outer membrane protein OmpA-like peptidoglycan-associated protein